MHLSKNKIKKIIFIFLFTLLLGIFYLVFGSTSTTFGSTSTTKISAADDSSLSKLAELLAPPEINFDSFDGFSDVIGMDEIKDEVQLYINRFNPQNNKQFNQILRNKNKQQKHPKGILFYGPPGTGKTYLAKAIAKESKMNFYTITPSSSMKEIENIFKKARQNSPSIVFADEAEEVVKSRDGTLKLEEGDAKKTNLFLTEIDGVKTDPDNPIFFIAATNHFNKIDDAIKSRLSHIYIGYLNKDERLKYLQVMANKYKFSNDSRKYFETEIIPRFQQAADYPEIYAQKINKKFTLKDGRTIIFRIPSISISEEDMKGKLLSAASKSRQQELKNKYSTIFEDSQSLENEKQKYYAKKAELRNKINDNNKLDDLYNDELFNILNSYDEYFEKIKEHFADILSNRKLDAFLLKIALIAGNNNHEMIEISDLEEASLEYFGPNLDYINSKI